LLLGREVFSDDNREQQTLDGHGPLAVVVFAAMLALAAIACTNASHQCFAPMLRSTAVLAEREVSAAEGPARVAAAV
jgi:hypothetical protein